jgi:hypothetical protein
MMMLLYGYQSGSIYIPPTSSPQLSGNSTHVHRQVLGGSVALGSIRRDGPSYFRAAAVPDSSRTPSLRTHDRQITFRNRGPPRSWPRRPLEFLPWPDDCAHYGADGSLWIDDMTPFARLAPICARLVVLWPSLLAALPGGPNCRVSQRSREGHLGSAWERRAQLPPGRTSTTHSPHRYTSGLGQGCCCRPLLLDT